MTEAAPSGSAGRVRRFARRLIGAARTRVKPAGRQPARSHQAATTESRDVLGPYLSLLPPKRRRTVVVVTSPDLRTQPLPWLHRFAADRLHLLAAGDVPEWRLDDAGVQFHEAASVSGIAGRLKAIGPVDVLIDLLPITEAEHRDLWRRLFYQVAQGGLYIVDRRILTGDSLGTAIGEWYSGVAASTGGSAAKAPVAVTELVDSTAGLTVTRDLVLVVKRQRHYLKVRHEEAQRVLHTRERRLDLRVLESRAAGELVSAADVVHHPTSTSIQHMEPTLPYPTMDLRHYAGQIAFLGSGLFVTGSSILPDSFRHHLIAEPVNPMITSVSPAFARLRGPRRPAVALDGDYFNLDSTYSGHFGHLMTEVISKLWGWDRAKREFPDLKVLLRLGDRQRDADLEQLVFGAYGIDPADIVTVREPVRIRSLVSATPMWHNAEPHYVHPDIVDVWHRLTDGLIDPTTTSADRIFVSRGRQLRRRTCRNIDDVERFFADRGFTIVYPEELQMGQQVAVFANATTIAGFGGSALFNIMHARRLKTLIVLSHESYTARNEHLFTALLGPQTHYFWSAADLDHPGQGWSKRAFYSDWEFDFDRNAAELDEVIAAL